MYSQFLDIRNILYICVFFIMQINLNRRIIHTRTHQTNPNKKSLKAPAGGGNPIRSREQFSGAHCFWDRRGSPC